MTKTEDRKRTRRIIRTRRILHQAESQIWFDAPTYEDIAKALNTLSTKLPPKLAKKFLADNGIVELTNFWVEVSDRKQMKGVANADDLLKIFHQISHYCNYWSEKYGQMPVTEQASNPLE